MNNYAYSRVMAVCVYYFQYNLYVRFMYVYPLSSVSITQFRKDTEFGLDNWLEWEKMQ
jgi:hypothetical protein